MNGEILEVALLEQERKGQDMGVPNNYTGEKKGWGSAELS